MFSALIVLLVVLRKASCFLEESFTSENVFYSWDNISQKVDVRNSSERKHQQMKWW